MALSSTLDFGKATGLIDFHDSTSLILILLSSALLLFIAKSVKDGKGKNIPPGSMGLPLIGETFQFLGSYRANKHVDWIDEKVAKYGPVFKTSLMGSPTVVLMGQAANRFMFSNDYNTILTKQPKCVSEITGRNNIIELCGEDHKRMRAAFMQFLKPEALQKFVGKMDSTIRHHFKECWEGKEIITIWPSMEQLTFQFVCNLFFSMNESCHERETLRIEFITAIKGMWSLPLDLPGMTFSRSLKARSKIVKHLSSLLEVRRRELQEGKASPGQDLLACLLSLKAEDALTKEEIIDNVIAIMIAGHDSTAVLLTHLVKTLAQNPHIYQNILQEQMTVLAEKKPAEPLAWEDIQKMKYTWRVAQEVLRLTPPLYGGFRQAIKDIDYGGYIIPKGWQLFWVTSGTHMNEDIFKEPRKFDPSRFESSVPPYSFITFGAGARICPGSEFVRMKVVIFLHHLVSKYKWSMAIPDEKIICDPMPRPAMGLPIKVQAKDK